MVIITLAPSSTTATIGALGAIGGAISETMEQKRENARKDEMLRLSQEKLKLAGARAQGQQQEQQRADSERAARLELDELRRGGVATPSDIKKAEQFGITRGVGENIIRSMGGLGFEAGSIKAAEQKAQQQRAAIDGIFPNLSPADRKALLGEFKESEDTNARMKMAGGIATKLRNYARMKDVLPDEAQNQILDQHIAAVEKYLEDPTPEGMQGVLKSEDAVEKMVEEQQADVQRQTIADGFDAYIRGTFTENMSGTMISDGLRISSDVRTQKISPDEGKGQWLAISDPKAAGHTARYVAKERSRIADEKRAIQDEAELKAEFMDNPADPDGPSISVWVYPGQKVHASQGLIGSPDWKMAMRIRRNAFSDNPTPRYDRSAGTPSPGAVPGPGTTPPAGKPDAEPSPERKDAIASGKKTVAKLHGGTSWMDLPREESKALTLALINGMKPSDIGLKRTDIPIGVGKAIAEARAKMSQQLGINGRQPTDPRTQAAPGTTQRVGRTGSR